ncbi:MAG: CDP-alcohol phosphatidyltransferase family protein [Oscillospiraceae bacterium]|nr:CDP-alcohol phosphatidyltransferase family protein [Oscillospiraceae bacterium]
MNILRDIEPMIPPDELIEDEEEQTEPESLHGGGAQLIGFYDYTVVLTYASLICAFIGIIVALLGHNPFLATLFLQFCALFDTFDGKVARTKKDRSPAERSFGIQIDSLSDLVAFCVAPACILAAMVSTLATEETMFRSWPQLGRYNAVQLVAYAMLCVFILNGMIRLAYFNVEEMERQQAEGGSRKYYLGLPVTSTGIVIPMLLLMQRILPQDLSLFCVGAAFFMGLLFISPIRVRKPGWIAIAVIFLISLATLIGMVKTHAYFL